MQLTRFHQLIRNFPRQGEHVLHSTLSDEMVGLDDAALRSLTQSLPTSGRSNGGLADEDIDWLREQRFLVAGDAEDEAHLDELLLEHFEGSGTLHLTLMVTERCNMACPYCFEGARGVGARVSSATEERTHEWVSAYMDAHDISRLVVQYFGGEPLLDKPFVIRTATRFEAEAAARGHTFGCTIITNGLSLDPSFMEQMASLGLIDVKVTLDGDRTTHDEHRIRRGGGGTFDAILRNVEAVSGIAPVRVGANVSCGREREYGALIGRLVSRGLSGALSELRFKPVIESMPGSVGASSFSDADTEALADLALSARRAGLAPLPAFALGPCGLGMKHYLAIDCEGRVYECELTMSDPKMAIGDVRRAPSEDDALSRRAPLKLPGSCRRCAFAPSCGGGCQAVTWRRLGRFGPNCERKYFRSAGRRFVEQRYLDEHYEGRLPSSNAA